MDDDGVEIPEIECRQIAGQDLLRFNIVGAAACGVDTLRGVVEERVDAGVGIVAAVGAMRRKICSGENVAENIRLLVTADPSKRIHLKCSAANVGEKCRGLIAAYVQRDAYAR